MIARPFSVLALSLALVATPLAAVAAVDAKPVKTVEVRFKPGATSAIYKGSVRGYQFDSYRFYAQKGQMLNVNWDNSNPNVDVSVRYLGKEPGHEYLMPQDQVLPVTGPYELRVFQTRNGARKNNNLRRYEVKVTITGAGANAATDLTGTQAAVLNSKWINYRCQGGKTLQARYHMGEATASAQIKAAGKTFMMDYDQQSNADITVFSGEGHNWSVTNLGAKNIHRADNGFLTRNAVVLVNGKKTAVAQIVRKNCDPVK